MWREIIICQFCIQEQVTEYRFSRAANSAGYHTTIEDLDNVERDDFKKPTDPDNIDSNVEINSDNEEESKEETSEDNSEENEKEESDDRSSLIPFP